MAKKALINLVCGDKVIEKGKIYKDEDVADLDATSFETVASDETSEVRIGVAGEEAKEEAKETVAPELDTEEKKEDGADESSTSGEETDTAPENTGEENLSDFEAGK